MTRGGSLAAQGPCSHCGTEALLDEQGLCDVCARALVSQCPTCGNPLSQCICKLDEPGGD